MPRGTRKTYEEQLGELDGQIVKAQNRLDELMQAKSELEKRQQEAKMAEIYGMMKENHLGPEEVKSAIGAYLRAR